MHDFLKTGYQVDLRNRHLKESTVRCGNKIGEVRMFGQIEILSHFAIHSGQFLGRAEDGCRGGMAEICHLVASVVHEQGYLRVRREIVPFPGGAGGSEKKVAQIEGEENGHQIGIRSGTCSSGENGERLVVAEFSQDIWEFFGSGHCRMYTSMKWMAGYFAKTIPVFRVKRNRKPCEEKTYDLWYQNML
jgi:hypothetical protein